MQNVSQLAFFEIFNIMTYFINFYQKLFDKNICHPNLESFSTNNFVDKFLKVVRQIILPPIEPKNQHQAS